ncbi:class I SAM-dependent methyltransferase [Propionimicrobium lymphophilum]|uniref:class I SAM-dependent methyltransferase n=1 Tax=Propionimicrobium lymphophilum TaxID=33012 RepID=UPI00048C7F72|nr:class I SAM-dependent methyltransferase [Propionimicrobium lymphophilum]
MTKIVDFGRLWKEDLAADKNRRVAEPDDLRFWAKNSSGYNQRAGNPAEHVNTLAYLRTVIKPGTSVLDIGTGTGRIALDLAEHGCKVTALDASIDMLEAAEAEAKLQGLKIEFVHSSWPIRLEKSFEYTVASWSLYRQRDLLGALRAMVEQTRSIAFAIDTTGAPNVLDEAIAISQGKEPEPTQARTLLLAGGFAQLGIPVGIELITEKRKVTANQLATLLKDSQKLLSDRAKEYLDRNAQITQEGWLYPRTRGVVYAKIPRRN